MHRWAAQIYVLMSVVLVLGGGCDDGSGDELPWYDAFISGGGAWCGDDLANDYYCLPGDRCADDELRSCEAVLSACQPDEGLLRQRYDASASSTGSWCGLDDFNNYYCLPGDRCADSSTRSCEIILSSCLF